MKGTEDMLDVVRRRRSIRRYEKRGTCRPRARLVLDPDPRSRECDGRPAEEHVRRILGLPEALRVLCMVSIGYPAEQEPPVPAEELAWDKILLKGGQR